MVNIGTRVATKNIAFSTSRNSTLIGRSKYMEGVQPPPPLHLISSHFFFGMHNNVKHFDGNKTDGIDFTIGVLVDDKDQQKQMISLNTNFFALNRKFRR